MGNFVSSMSKDDPGKLSWMQVLILGLIPLGQLWARIFNFNGSLDKWWLLMPPLSIPPLSLIPAFMIAFGKIKKGQGGSPYDLYMIIPAICSILADNYLRNNTNFSSINKSIILFFINFIKKRRF